MRKPPRGGRLKEEMGLDLSVREAHRLRYKTQFPNLLIENEYDYIFVAESDAEPTLNPEEAEDWKWLSPEAVKRDFSERPEQYSHWFKLSFDDVLAKR